MSHPLRALRAPSPTTPCCSSPSHAPMDYYTKDYEKGLQLYSNGVLIMDKCPDLLPDCFSFVRGMVDSAGSVAEHLPRDAPARPPAQGSSRRVWKRRSRASCSRCRRISAEDYEKFWAAFGRQIKYGAIRRVRRSSKELLQDLLMYHSSDREQAGFARGATFPV